MSASDDNEEIALWNTEDAKDLERKKPSSHDIQITSRDWTVKTMVEQISEGNVDLDPAFQRRNAWRDSRRSRLLESFILSFPVPQIVLAEHPKRKKKFIVIDGKQRLMTIASAYLTNFRDYWQDPRITGLNILKGLNKVSLEAFMSAADHADSRRQLDNADIRTTIISGFSDESILYDIFYRINTGSVPLSSQELRQVLNRGPFAKYLMDTTTERNPLWPVLRIDQPDARLRDVELLLRLVSWTTRSREYKGNMKPFLDDTMNYYNDHWAREKRAIESLVPQVFEGVEAASKIYGPYAGRKYSDDEFETALNRVVFEVQAFYFQTKRHRTAAIQDKKKVVTMFKELCGDQDFRATIEATTKSIENYRTRFDKYRTALGKVIGQTLDPLPLGRA